MLTQIFMTKYYKNNMNNKNTKLSPKNIIKLFLGIIPIFILAIIISCENETSPLGEELLPDSDKIQYHIDSSLTFSGSVFKKEPFNTLDLEYYSLGKLNDEYFGILKGEYLGQFLPSKYDPTILYQLIDSAVIYIRIDTTYGSTLINPSFEVFELLSEIDENSDHLSDADISDFYSPIDAINTRSYLSGDTLLALNLSDSFIQKLISVDDSIYKTPSSFLTAFNGVAIAPSPSSASRILYANINSNNTKLVLYYRDTIEFVNEVTGYEYFTLNDTTFNYTFSDGHRFAKYSTDYSSSIVNNYLTNPDNENDDLLFIQGLEGVSSKITFTNIEPWILEDSSYSILRAELTVPVLKDDNFESFPPPSNLFFYYNYDSDSTLFQVEDYSQGTMFDGSYNKEENNYHFNISKHLLRILQEDIADSCLNFSIAKMSSFPHRVILKSSENIKLNVTYTKH